MKIVVLKGSPVKNGSSNLLAEHFIRGAREAGHQIKEINVAHQNVRVCTGCVYCNYGRGTGCIQNDDVNEIKREILSADMMVFVTPLYYFGMSAQLKILIDRFCAFNQSIQEKHMASALISVAANDDDWTFEALELHYKTLVWYLKMQNMGMILGAGCGNVELTKNSQYPELAYIFGRELK